MKKYIFAVFVLILLVVKSFADVTFQIDRERVRFRTNRALGTINTIINGQPATIGHITGLYFRVIAIDSATGRRRDFDDFVEVTALSSIPTVTQIKNTIRSHVISQNYRGRAENFFSLFSVPAETVDIHVDGILDITDTGINP